VGLVVGGVFLTLAGAGFALAGVMAGLNALVAIASGMWTVLGAIQAGVAAVNTWLAATLTAEGLAALWASIQTLVLSGAMGILAAVTTAAGAVLTFFTTPLGLIVLAVTLVSAALAAGAVWFFAYIAHRATIASGLDVAQEDASTIEVHNRRESSGAVSSRELRVDQTERAVSLNRGNRVLTDESSYADGLAFVGEATLRLPAQRDVFERLTVYRASRADAAPEADDLAVPHEQRAVHVAMAKIKPDRTASFAGDETAIPHRSGIVRVELQADGAGIAVSDVERHVLNVIMKPIRRSKPATPHDARGLLRIGERAVLQANDRAPGILSLDEVLAPSVLARRVLLRPLKRLGDEIRSIRKIEELVLSHHVDERPLNRLCVVRDAVSFRVIGSPHDVDDRRTRRIGDVRFLIERGSEDGCVGRVRGTPRKAGHSENEPIETASHKPRDVKARHPTIP